MFTNNDRFPFSDYDAGRPGNSEFGQAHGPQIDIRPELPQTTGEVTGVDLTHTLHTEEVGGAGKGGGFSSAKPGGTTSFQPYTSGAAGGFNITLEFKGSWTQAYYDIFKAAADKLTALIVQDIPGVNVRTKGGVIAVDDILITAELGRIDGLYGVLGQAGPTSIRNDGSYLPATAQMKFDIADVNAMSTTDFSYVVLHEMAHSLGFGSIWSYLGLVQDGFYTGAAANAEFNALGGLGRIPVEQDGGAGTAGSHWDETFFDAELMTGYINEGRNYFSEISAAAFEDLGYGLAGTYPPFVDRDYVI